MGGRSVSGNLYVNSFRLCLLLSHYNPAPCTYYIDFINFCYDYNYMLSLTSAFNESPCVRVILGAPDTKTVCYNNSENTLWGLEHIKYENIQ